MELDPAPFEGLGSGVDALVGTQTGSSAGRRDGRSPNEMRQLEISQGVLTRADGSARIRCGGTDVLVAIYGPMECPINKQSAEEVHVHVSYRRREGIAGSGGVDSGMEKSGGAEATVARDLRRLVSEVVLATLHPRKALVVAVQILSDNGSVGAAAVNASVMALIDAGVPMKAVPTAACVSVNNDTLVVDPVRVEESEADAVMTVAFETGSSNNGFMSIYTKGDCGGKDVFAAAVETSRQLAVKTRTFMKMSVEMKTGYPFVWSSA